MTTTTASGQSGSLARGQRPSAIRLENVEKVYRTDRIETVALTDVNLDIADGEFVSVMGPSGSGKSTLLNVIGLLDVPSSGRVLVKGASVESSSDAELARIRNREIGFVFQTFHLIPDLDVMDNVELPLLYRKTPRGERRARVEAALERVGLTARKHHRPSQLSGGQRQRVAIARAVVGEPTLLLADEPTGNLDSQMGAEVMAILESMNRDHGTTVVMVTHDPVLAERTARTIRIFDGRQVH